MKILGIETSTRCGSVALVDGKDLVREADLPIGRGHSSSLVPALDRMLRGARVRPGEIGGIAAGIGPGSFTGIRLALATARGLAMGLGVPLRGVSTFDNLLARYGGNAERVCAIVNAHSYGLYASVYERRGSGYKCVEEPFVCQPHELPERLRGAPHFLGPDTGMFRDLLSGLFGARASFTEEDLFPRASTAALLYGSPVAVPDDSPPGIAPLYLLPGVRRKPVRPRAS